MTNKIGLIGLSSVDIVGMVSEARPRKIGFWEYRLSHDKSRGKGVRRIVDTVLAATI
jgi:hypothetical protein